MRSHGWSGRTPASDEEAIERILDAVDLLVAAGDSTIRITDVARELGVSRPTVYRYFPNTQALLVASRVRSTDGLLDRLADHVRGLTDPAAAVVEGVAFAAEQLAGDQQMKQLLLTRVEGDAIASFTTELGMSFGRIMLHRYDVDWKRHGYDDEAVDELAELALRTVHSILIDPGSPPRSGVALRHFLARWLGPAVLYPQVVRSMEALNATVDVGCARPA